MSAASPQPRIPDCPICALADERCILTMPAVRAFRDDAPRSPGHTLILPRRCVGYLFDLTPGEIAELDEIVKAVEEQIAAEFQPSRIARVLCDADSSSARPHAHLQMIPEHEGKRETEARFGVADMPRDLMPLRHQAALPRR